MLRTKRKAPSLVDLCVNLAVENVKYLGDVGETDLHLLDRILPHCTLDQLMHIEKSTVGRDLSSVTDKLWKTFYEKQFGERSTNLVIERMRQKKVSFRWLQLYEAKLKEIAEAENKLAARIRQLYKKEDDRSGPGYNLSNGKSNLMKKAKMDFLKSREVQNIAAMKKNALPGSSRSSSMMKPPSSFPGKSSASSNMKSLERRF
uniref:Elongin-A n=1 Tax=Salix viminalis TaxID=40686 RepID=A0A6N2LIX6_SALVM